MSPCCYYVITVTEEHILIVVNLNLSQYLKVTGTVMTVLLM